MKILYNGTMNLLRINIFISIIFFITTTSLYGSNNFKSDKLKVGDLIFQNLDNSKLADAIEKIAPGYNGFPISHVAMIYSIDNKKIILIEAYGRVQFINLTEFLNRSIDENGNPEIIVGRLKKVYSGAIQEIIKNCKRFIGKSYDPEFSIYNDKYYCSELIYNIFKFKNKNIFKLKPMNYISDDYPSVTKFWKYYFNVILKIEVPQGKPGITPGDISLSQKINILYLPDNYRAILGEFEKDCK